MPIIQDIIHKMEVAGGLRYGRIGLALLAVIGGTVYYNIRCFKNMSCQEAMDSAQLARNIARGKGYTTSFIRPFSMFLLRKQNEQKNQPVRGADYAQIKEGHPDIANPPVYPLVLAGAMKVLPFRFTTAENEKYLRYQPDFLIGIFNQVLFFALIASIFFLARRLFDSPTAWLSAGLLFGADVFWRFTISGLSTMLVLLILSGIAWCLVLLEERARNQDFRIVPLIILPFLAGLLCGLGGLTRYSFLWLLVPMVGYLLLFGGPTWTWRCIASAIAALVCLIVVFPWLIRNHNVSGAFFGIPGYAVFSSTPIFPDNSLERSLQPDFTLPAPWLTLFTQKALINLRHMVRADLFSFTGGFVTAFFLVGLLVVIPNPTASRLRYFVLASLGVLIFVQALGRTYLSDESPEINSENLLIFLAPLVIVFGVHFFWLLLGQIYLPIRELRYVVIGVFCFLCCLPMLFNFLPPRPHPVAYPPYWPFYVEKAASYAKEDELTMGDLPWAMAWYGRVPSIWATQGYEPFFDIDSLQKRITAVYFTTATMNGNFFSKWHPTSDAWGALFTQMWGLLRSESGFPREINLTLPRINGPPTPFPLHYLQSGWPQECLMTSRKNPVQESTTK